MFRKNNKDYIAVARYGFSRINGNYISTTLVNDALSGTKITGFIRLNDDSNTIFSIELENATQGIFSDTKLSKYATYTRAAAIFPNGTPNNNKMVVFISDSKNAENVQAFYVKKGTAYITNDWLSTTEKNTQLYLTSDAETQKYLTTKSLSDIWTEINSLNKNDFEAYNEDIDNN